MKTLIPADAIARVKPIETEEPNVTVCGNHAALDYPGERIALVKVDGKWYIDALTGPGETSLAEICSG